MAACTGKSDPASSKHLLPAQKHRGSKIYLASGQERKINKPQFQLQIQRTVTYVQVCMSVGQSRAAAAQLCTHEPRAELVLMFIFLGNTLDILWMYFLLGVFNSCDFQRLCSAPHCGSSCSAAPSLAQNLWAEILGDGNFLKRQSQGEQPTSQWAGGQAQSQCHRELLLAGLSG